MRKNPDLNADEVESTGARWRRRLRKGLSGITGAALVASSLVVAATVTAAPAYAADPFQCTPEAIYVQSSAEVREFTVTDQGSSLGTTGLGSGHSNNALGISAGGQYAYTITNSTTPGTKTLATYDRVADVTTPRQFSLNVGSIVRGAVHPETGAYYFATGTQADGTIHLYAWNPTTPTVAPVVVGRLSASTGSAAFGSSANGDMAFSASGQLVLVADRYVYAADIPSTIASSTAIIPAKQVHDMGTGVAGNGIAFGNLGHIFVSAGSPNRVMEIDLARGVTVETTPIGVAPTDLASCTFPNTLTLKKDVPGGRDAATDQFGLRIDSPAGYQVPQTNAVTTGNETGLQPDYAGPIFTNQGDTFSLSESASGTTQLGRYDSTLVCEQQNPDGSTTPVAVTGSNQVVQPAGPLGTDVVCTFVNELLVPGLTLNKTSDPATGAPVEAGQRITYTVEAENTGNTVLDPVEITDDLSAVLAHADYQDDVTTEIDGTEVTSGAAVVAGDELAWTGALEPGQIVTITYSVIVDEDAAGEQIANRVTASGTPPGPFDPVVPPAVTTEHPVAGFEVDKTADPASGSVVEPGQVIEYTVTARNAGATVLDPVSVSDDLSTVFANAEYNDDIETVIDGEPVASGAASITGDALTWTGALQPGQVLTITYSVTVDADASGQVLRNTASGTATPTVPNPEDPAGPPLTGEPIEPPAVTTQHPVIGSGFTVSKTADPASGTAVEAGDTITYTITGTNTGDTTLDPAEIVDDLAAVLDDAEYNDDADANRGSVAVAGDTLTWTGSIPAGASVVITYSVTVDAGVTSALLRNSATGEATPRIPLDPADPDGPSRPGTPLTPPPSSTTHPVVDNGLELEKTANPASGTPVQAGQTIEYTLTATNTGNTVLDPATVSDDLSGVLGSAVYNDDADASAGTVAVTGTQLTWTGTLAPGEQVEITYSVVLDADATGVLLRNVATGEGTPLIPADPTDPDSPTTPGEPVTTPPATTEHPVANPGFTVTKTADPATGSRVDPGSVIEYTVTGTNTGDTVLDPVSISDDLAGVLGGASYNDDAVATTGTVSVAGSALEWTGSLAAGSSVEITYSVTVDADAGGETLRNSVAGSATPRIPVDPSDPDSPTTPGTPLDPPRVVTEHPVNQPGFEFSKSVDPASGTAVDPGQVLTYTLTGRNTGETALDPVEIADDLSGVLAFAAITTAPAAVIDGAPASAPVVTGDELSWTGSLAVGQTVTITYAVTVGPDAAGEVLTNSATGTATPPGGETITPPPGTTTTPVNEPGFSLSKSASPESGTAVDPGSVITYTVTGVNTGETALDPVEIVDDLSGVLGNAAYNGDAVATVDGNVVSAPVVAEGELTWSGMLEVGETVVVTYSVTVSADAGGAQLENAVVGTATPPGGVPPIETPPATTVHPVNEPGFELLKSADPSSGSRVDPGSVITYTVTGVNTGETVLDPVEIVDDLSAVLAHADFTGDAVATIGGEPAAAPVVDGDELSWSGALQVGERVTLTYSVTVHGDAGGETLTNTVSGRAVPPGGAELTPPPVTTENPVGKPGFTFEKTADPASGTAVSTGAVVTYTLTGVNTGETGLDEVAISDDLAEVLRYASFNDDVVATVGDRDVAAPVLNGTVLTWNGSLAEGETVTVTYSVTVKADAAGKTLRNIATATATPPGGQAITPPPSVTEHDVLTPLAVTGGALLPWVLVFGILLLLAGAFLVAHRRRMSA